MKQYMKPEIELITNVVTAEPLAASPETVKGDDLFRWGNGADPYGNSDWVNEGHFDPLDMGDNDEDGIDSRAKGGNMWDD